MKLIFSTAAHVALLWLVTKTALVRPQCFSCYCTVLMQLEGHLCFSPCKQAGGGQSAPQPWQAHQGKWLGLGKGWAASHAATPVVATLVLLSTDYYFSSIISNWSATITSLPFSILQLTCKIMTLYFNITYQILFLLIQVSRYLYICCRDNYTNMKLFCIWGIQGGLFLPVDFWFYNQMIWYPWSINKFKTSYLFPNTTYCVLSFYVRRHTQWPKIVFLAM